jgi:hypothetical protein
MKEFYDSTACGRPLCPSFFLPAVENLLLYILKVEREVFGTLKTPGGVVREAAQLTERHAALG